VLFRGKPFRLRQPYGTYVMENVLFKISFPAEFHAQTAVECAVTLHPQVAHRIDDVKKVVITTHESALRIIDKRGPLHNPADRDHCLQYMTAIGLLRGNLVAADYEDDAAADPRIDALRAKMVCVENRQWSLDYLDPRKRSIANAVQVVFRDGSKTENVAVEFPIGHRRRRAEGIPLLEAKFKANLARRFAPKQQRGILEVSLDPQRLETTAVHDYVDLFAS
jgi:2-methylcitrate dehydratase